MPITPCPIPCAPCSPPLGGNGIAHLGLNPLDPNNPFVNLSAEEPDADLFIGRRNPPPITGEPPLGDPWYAAGCLGFCISTISQEDADLCAAAQAVLCVAPQWPNPGTPPNPDEPPPLVPREVFYNDAQFCSFTCPDGSLFTFTVAAGYFNAFNKATANAMALAFACQKATQNRLCPGSFIPTSGCIGTAFAGSFSVSSGHLPVAFAVVAGSTPPGLAESGSPSSYQLSGVPTAAGDFTFTVQATDAIGGTIQKTFTISIYGIITGSELPDATLNTAYSMTLTPGPNLTGTLTYAITGGSLPDGLTLNSSTGEISGTPTVEGAYQINVRVSNGTVSCSKVFDLFVGPEAGFDWADLVWDIDNSFYANGGTGTISAVGDTLSGSISGDFGAPPPAPIAAAGLASEPLNFPGVSQNAKIVLTLSGLSGQLTFGFEIYPTPFPSPDPPLVSISDSFAANGVYEYPFTLSGPTDVNATFNIVINDTGGLSAANFSAQIVNT